MPASRARQAAFAILLRVENDRAFSTQLLHMLPLMNQLDARDRALAAEIVLGCLRWQGAIDASIAALSRRKIEKLDPEVRVALRMGGYQLCHLDRVPARAAISESVELVKQARKVSAARFVNAVLRRSPRERPSEQSHALAHPSWLVDRWRRIYGGETTAGILKANLTSPVTYLRLNARYPLEETRALLAQQGVESGPTEAAFCRRLRQGRPELTQCYGEGRVRIQDISSQMVVPLLDLDASHRFLDLCAAPGNKTCQALEQSGSAEKTVAADRHLHRLAAMKTLATIPTAMAVLDAGASLPFRCRFDRILVDVPCSGTGTLARNPEIKWRLRPEDLKQLAQKQVRILDRALRQLASGGVLVYSTCSLEPEENRAVVEAVLRQRTDCAAEAYLERVPGRDAGDGFYACKIVRRRSSQKAPTGAKQMIE